MQEPWNADSFPDHVEYLAQQRAFLVAFVMLLFGSVCHLISSVFLVEDKNAVDGAISRDAEKNTYSSVVGKVYDNFGMEILDEQKMK